MHVGYQNAESKRTVVRGGSGWISSYYEINQPSNLNFPQNGGFSALALKKFDGKKILNDPKFMGGAITPLTPSPATTPLSIGVAMDGRPHNMSALGRYIF